MHDHAVAAGVRTNPTHCRNGYPASSRAEDHTLAPQEVDELQNAVIKGLEDAGYPLRQ